MRDTFLPFAVPDVDPGDVEAVADTLRSGWITTGPASARLEAEFARYVGAEAALALNSGTAALHLALLALGIGEGDGVVVPTLTFSSAVHVVEHVGATPVLVDSEPDTLTIDPKLVEEAIEVADVPVRCIAPVHLYGQACDLEALDELADRHDLGLMEDAAHALPAALDDTRIGGTGNLTAFSFYATKNLTTGEGGMLTGPEELIRSAREWSLHGITKDAWLRGDTEGSWRYDVSRPGFKYNLSDVLAALGRAQLGRLDGMHARRTEIARRYRERLADLEEVRCPQERPGTTHAWHIFAIRLDLDRLAIDRDRFIAELRARNIGTSVHFIPVHTLTYYRDRYGFSPGDFPVADREWPRLISLPIHTTMTDGDVDDVTDAIVDVVETHRR